MVNGVGRHAVVVDEWAAIRHGIKALLLDAGLSSVETAGSVTPALPLVHSGDVVVLGHFDDQPHDSAVRSCREAGGLVIALTSQTDRAHVLQLCAAGAHAVIERAASELDVKAAIAQLTSGNRYLSPTLLAGMFVEPGRHATPRPSELTTRERQVLALAAEGRSNREIAGALHIGAETVKTHLANVYLKLGVRRRDQAVVLALRHGLI
jgi:DNA-binding NarL/FixJ family response regulator